MGEKKKRKEISKKKPAPKFFYFILFFIFFSLSFKLPDRCYAMYFVWEANGICTLRINFFYYVNPAPPSFTVGVVYFCFFYTTLVHPLRHTPFPATHDTSVRICIIVENYLRIEYYVLASLPKSFFLLVPPRPNDPTQNNYLDTHD